MSTLSKDDTKDFLKKKLKEKADELGVFVKDDLKDYDDKKAEKVKVKSIKVKV